MHLNFDIEKYLNIKRDIPTIFAYNCWGGLTYHSLDLPFYSPTINMFFDEEGYIKFLKEPTKYINTSLKYEVDGYQDNSDISCYPIARCDDILLYFNHAKTFDEAEMIWEKRKKRINWDNIIVMMYTESEKTLQKFLELPYEKKICFVTFEYQNEQVLSLNYRKYKELKDIPFWKIVNGMAKGSYEYYDVFDLINEGKITKIIKE